ncbi:hypothetical protein HMPREF9130_1031 [Peptoniphilus sp. oral taxon 375 str. F0436]|nr:hypothetical protein HMPREF9130_1031 [Peptoniphilus sp. oral taxon 375 str. F0436]
MEVRRLNILDEDMDDKSMVQAKLSFYKNYNIGRFFKKLKADFDLESVKLSKQEDWDQEI